MLWGGLHECQIFILSKLFTQIACHSTNNIFQIKHNLVEVNVYQK